jgi:Flp pilus assembly protein TadD
MIIRAIRTVETMRNKSGLWALCLLSAGFGIQLGGCGGEQKPAAKTAASHKGEGDEEGGLMGGSTKPNAEQLIPKEKKRQLTADQRAEFDKAMQRYDSAKKSGGLSGSECDNVAAAFKRAADDNPGLPEARFNQGAVLSECGREDEAARVWRGLKYGPAISNLGYIAWKNGEPGEAESLFNKAIEADPLHTVEARNNLAQILRDKARHASTQEEKRQYIQGAVNNLRSVLALDSNNLQAFSTLAFIYYDMNMLEMAKLVGNQAIKKADEIATGKFEEEKAEEAAEGKAGKGKKEKKKKESGKEGDEEGKLAKEVDVREVGTGVTPQMKLNLAVVHNTLGLVELKRKNISPAITQFKQAVAMNPGFNEARLNLAALSLNNRDYKTAEENFRAVLESQPKNYEAAIGLGVALRGGKKIPEAEAQYNEAQKLDPSNPSSYFNLGLLYQEYMDGQKPTLQKAQGYYRQFLSKANQSTPSNLQKEAEKRIKDIDEIYVALEEAAKMQAEAEAMQRKAEEQQKQMEEQMKKQEAEEAAAAAAAKKPGANGAAPAEGAPAPAPAGGEAPKDGAKPADGAGAGAGAAAPPADDTGAPKGKKKKKK